MQSTRYYDTHASALHKQYGNMRTEQVHRDWLKDHLPREPGLACDVGAGSGRDANWLAEAGWDVIAVEPSGEMRKLAQAQSNPRVTWLDDALPGLDKLRSLGHRFDLVLVSAVWMHLAPSARSRAFRVLSELLKPSGVLVITLRHGSDEAENAERGFYRVSGEELRELAKKRAIANTASAESPDPTRLHVRWETLVFTLPDDGTGSLPLLRHIIVNDDKSSSYKLGLLRVLTKIAETAPGAVLRRTDDYVDIPLGIVGLFWLKQYKPLLLTHQIPQSPDIRRRYGFAKDDFRRLSDLSSYDLRVGACHGAEMAAVVDGAIYDACKNITDMPATFITFPGTGNPVFGYERARRKRVSGALSISLDYLAKFGSFRVPAAIWQAMGQYACWLEPAIVQEWSRLSMGWRIADFQATEVSVFAWEEGRRDTSIAASRVSDLVAKGAVVNCVWSARRARAPQIDHCFPWSRWLNNDLWNLMPAHADVNASKGDRLPSAETMSDSRHRIQLWWQHAYLESGLRERFLLEARCSLPGLDVGHLTSEAIFSAAQYQRARLKSDQSLQEWSFLPRQPST